MDKTESIRKDIRAIAAKYDGRVNFEDWDKKDGPTVVTMVRAVMTFKIEN